MGLWASINDVIIFYNIFIPSSPMSNIFSQFVQVIWMNLLTIAWSRYSSRSVTWQMCEFWFDWLDYIWAHIFRESYISASKLYTIRAHDFLLSSQNTKWSSQK